MTPWDRAALAADDEARRRARLLRLGGGAADEAAAVAAAPRTVREAEALDFEATPAWRLPDAAREALAEHRRRRGWRRVVPMEGDPWRHAELFEAPKRPCDVLLRRALAAFEGKTAEPV